MSCTQLIISQTIIPMVSRFFQFKSPWSGTNPKAAPLAKRFLRLTRQPRRRRQAQGFSLILVFLLVLTVLTTTTALNSRIIAGLYGQSLQGKLRMARNAAENGLILASSELNKPGNRLLLGEENWSNWLNRWNGQNYFTMHNYAGMNGDCKIYGSGTYQVTEQAAKLASESALQIETGANQGSKIIAFYLYDKNYNPVQKASKTELSHLVLASQGYYNSNTAYKAGETWKVDEGSNAYNSSLYKTTKYVLQQEYDVIPKCCGRSFGGDFGTDSKIPDGGGSCPDGRFVEWFIRGATRASAHNNQVAP